jgi:hypothetical protein
MPHSAYLSIVGSTIMHISLSWIGYNVSVVSVTWTFIYARWLRHDFSDQCEDISLGDMPYYLWSDPIFIVSFSVMWCLTKIQLMLYCNKSVQIPQIHIYAVSLWRHSVRDCHMASRFLYTCLKCSSYRHPSILLYIASSDPATHIPASYALDTVYWPLDIPIYINISTICPLQLPPVLVHNVTLMTDDLFFNPSMWGL